MLVRRTMLVRYSQTAIGIAWAMLQPLALMLVFSLFFGLLVRVPSDGIPYPLFFCVGLWVWQFAGQAVAQGSTAVIANDHIVSKVYFPRAMLPAAAVAVALVDMVAAAPALAAVMVAYGSVPDPLGILVFLGALIALCMLLLGLALWLSALQAFYRDVAYLVPFSLQLWMFVSPIIYPASIVPDAWRAIYGLNPMVAVVEAARAAFAGGPLPGSATLLPAFAVSITSLLAGHRYFRLREAQLADVV
jgi:lipopolysaccharide transport system permease protein